MLTFSQAYTTDANHETISAIDPMHTKTMGQRVTASFLDTKLVNRAYCEGEFLRLVHRLHVDLRVVLANFSYDQPSVFVRRQDVFIVPTVMGAMVFRYSNTEKEFLKELTLI